MSAHDTLRRPQALTRRPVVWPWLRSWSLKRLRPVLLPGGVLLAIVLAVALAPWLAPHDPDAIDMSVALAGPSAAHPLGTDQLGRDQLSRLLYGGRATLSLAAFGTLSIIALGLLVGVVAGYSGGRVDLVISSLLTVLLALPNLLLTLAILGILGPGTRSLLIALIGAGWVGHARIFRAAVLGLRTQPYMEAAIGLGARPLRIIWRELLPNLLPTVVVLATLDLGALLLIISSLSFLGLGAQPPAADWGVMLNDARPFFAEVPLLAIAPGVCITCVALASNMLGDTLRDLVDRGR